MSRRSKEKSSRPASANIIASAATQIFVTLVKAASREKEKERERRREKESGCDKLARKTTILETLVLGRCRNQKSDDGGNFPYRLYWRQPAATAVIICIL